MSRNSSPHILSTSANLLGFCLFVITGLHFANQGETRIIDALTSVMATLLSFSCIFSFLSIRTQKAAKEKRYETIADYLFVCALAGILIIILLITLNFIN